MYVWEMNLHVDAKVVYPQSNNELYSRHIPLVFLWLRIMCIVISVLEHTELQNS